MDWKPENIERVRALAAAGFSASQIAFQIGGGVSRSAVVGCGFRNDIQFHGTAYGVRNDPDRVTNYRPKPRQQFKEQISFVAAPDTPPLEPLMITFDDLQPHDCRYVFGERPMDFKFCGLPALEGRSWCLNHCRVVYQPLQERRHVAQIA